MPANNPTERTCSLKKLVIFVDEDEVEVVARAGLMFTSRKIGIRSNPLRNCLTGVVSLWWGRTAHQYLDPRERDTSHWRAVHDFEPCDHLILVVPIWRRASGLVANDSEVYVLDIDA